MQELATRCFWLIANLFFLGRNRKAEKLAKIIKWTRIVVPVFVIPLGTFVCIIALMVVLGGISNYTFIGRYTLVYRVADYIANDTLETVGAAAKQDSLLDVVIVLITFGFIMGIWGFYTSTIMLNIDAWFGWVLGKGSFMIEARKLFGIEPPERNFPIITTMTKGWEKLNGEENADNLWFEINPACHTMAHSVFNSRLKHKYEDIALFGYGVCRKATRPKGTDYPRMDIGYRHQHSLVYGENGMLVQSFTNDMDSYPPFCIDMKALSIDFKNYLRDFPAPKRQREVRKLTTVGSECLRGGRTRSIRDLFYLLKNSETLLYVFLTSKETDEKYKLTEGDKGNALYLLSNLQVEDYNFLCLPQSALGDEGYDHKRVYCFQVKHLKY